MTRPEEDEAWREIVENYGARPVLDDPPAADPPDADPDRIRDDEDLTAAAIGPRRTGPDPTPDDDSAVAAYDVADRFQPPEPPPIPIPAGLRLAAWSGLFGAPAVLLVCLVLGIVLPSPVALALVAWFAGGFGYLVWHMPKGPTDPWDNGARV
ncbi:hypothetical protein [Nocardioides sp.]|uniref:hypothetical protein n=1 Tax=Nocardioides sp. TaxID=35761 RepID=UPI002735BB8F|nr:hypothetical protein [Nocardioides sp.]MDP3893922.1 hypothetical protein [Nocardioides sp.]